MPNSVLGLRIRHNAGHDRVRGEASSPMSVPATCRTPGE